VKLNYLVAELLKGLLTDLFIWLMTSTTIQNGMKWEDDCIQLARIWKEAVIVSFKALTKSTSLPPKKQEGYSVTWR
jgi:hypothetical protein